MALEKMIRLNRFGFALCIAYLLLTCVCLWAAYAIVGDLKGRFILLQLPIALQLALLDWLGFRGWINDWGWPIAYTVFIPFTLLILYCIGVVMTRIWHRSKALAVTIALLPWLIVWFRQPLRVLYRAIFL